MARLPEAADTPLGREFGGVELSGGQWQRVALARTLATAGANNASVLVADEPIAQMDVRVEHQLHKTFSDVTAGRTTILVSHRFSTVQMADRIAVIDRGRVVETGSHAELMALNGRYADLFRMQASSFIEDVER